MGLARTAKEIGRKIDFGKPARITMTVGSLNYQTGAGTSQRYTFDKNLAWVGDINISLATAGKVTELDSTYTGYVGESFQGATHLRGKNTYWVSKDRRKAITLTDNRGAFMWPYLPVNLRADISSNSRIISIGERSVNVSGFDRLTAEGQTSSYIDYLVNCGVAYKKVSHSVYEVRILAPMGGYYTGTTTIVKHQGRIVLFTYTLEVAGLDSFVITAASQSVLIDNIDGKIVNFDARFTTYDEVYFFYGWDRHAVNGDTRFVGYDGKHFQLAADGSGSLSSLTNTFFTAADLTIVLGISNLRENTFPLWGFKGRVFTSYRVQESTTNEPLYYTQYKSNEPQTGIIDPSYLDAQGYHYQVASGTQDLGTQRIFPYFAHSIMYTAVAHFTQNLSVKTYSTHVVELVGGVVVPVMDFLPESEAASTFIVTFADPDKGVYVGMKQGVWSNYDVIPGAPSQTLPSEVITFVSTDRGGSWYDGRLLYVSNVGFYDLSNKNGLNVKFRPLTGVSLQQVTVVEKHPKLPTIV
jgi:hypothetical protein